MAGAAATGFFFEGGLSSNDDLCSRPTSLLTHLHPHPSQQGGSKQPPSPRDVGCVAAGAEAAAGAEVAGDGGVVGEKHPSPERKSGGGTEADPSRRDGLDTTPTAKEHCSASAADCPQQAAALQAVNASLRQFSATATASNLDLECLSIPDEHAAIGALIAVDWDPVAACDLLREDIFAQFFRKTWRGRFGDNHNSRRRGAGRKAANDAASKTTTAPKTPPSSGRKSDPNDGPSEGRSGRTAGTDGSPSKKPAVRKLAWEGSADNGLPTAFPLENRRPFGTSNNIQRGDVGTPKKWGDSPAPKGYAARRLTYNVPPLTETPSKHGIPKGSKEYAQFSKLHAETFPHLYKPSRRKRKRTSPPTAATPRSRGSSRLTGGRISGLSLASLEVPPSPISSDEQPSRDLIVPDVLAKAPGDWKDGNYCPIVKKLHAAQLSYFDKVKHVLNVHGLPPFWNLIKLPWSRDVQCKIPLLAMILHYQTKESARGLKEQHPAAARRSNGDLRERTWQCKEEAVGREVFEQTIQLDMYPFSFLHETSPTSELHQHVLDFVMKEWNETVLSVLHSENVTIALCSKATATLWAEYRLGGDMETLVASYEMDPVKYVSASEDGLVLPEHPSAMYNPCFWSRMETKCRTADDFDSAILRLVTGDPSARCTYYGGFFDENSDFLRLCQEKFLEGSRRGGRTMGERRTEAAALYDAGLDMQPEHVDALLACSRGATNGGYQAKHTLEEYMDLLALHTSASQRFHIFELKSNSRLKAFVVEKALDDLGQLYDKRFPGLKEIYRSRYAEEILDEQLTRALLQCEIDASCSSDGPSLPSGGQPKEMFDRWLLARKRKWRKGQSVGAAVGPVGDSLRDGTGEGVATSSVVIRSANRTGDGVAKSSAVSHSVDGTIDGVANSNVIDSSLTRGRSGRARKTKKSAPKKNAASDGDAVAKAVAEKQRVSTIRGTCTRRHPATSGPKIITIEIGPGSIGVEFGKDRRGICHVTRKGRDSSLLEVGDVVISLDGVELIKVPGASPEVWLGLFHSTSGLAKRRVVVARVVRDAKLEGQQLAATVGAGAGGNAMHAVSVHAKLTDKAIPTKESAAAVEGDAVTPLTSSELAYLLKQHATDHPGHTIYGNEGDKLTPFERYKRILDHTKTKPVDIVKALNDPRVTAIYSNDSGNIVRRRLTHIRKSSARFEAIGHPKKHLT